MATQERRFTGKPAWRAHGAIGAALLLTALLFIALAPRAQAAPYAAVVMDGRTGEILHARNHDTRLHPASLTKMMTIYVAFEAIQNGEVSLDTMITVSRRAASEVPSRLGLRAGQRIALRYLIRAAALRSGNDAATAIAEGISGSVEAFAARMNRTAAAIGMNNTRFLNAHGLTEVGHYSTARDMTLLGRQLYFDFPQYYNLFSRRSEHAGVARVNNTNVRFLDGYRGADGIKTGFTRAAGYNLTAAAERNGVRVFVTVFGGRSVIDRHRRVVGLMDMGFDRAPARVATRRPSRPDYARDAGGGSGRAAGRTIRLQTAPQRSLFPAPRPGREPDEPTDALLATLQQEIDAMVAEVGEVDAPPEPDPAALAADGAAQEDGAPETGQTAEVLAISPVPVPRPAEGLAAATETGPADDPEIATRAAQGGFGTAAALAEVALPETALPEDGPQADPETLAAADTPQATPAPRQFTHSRQDIGPVLIEDGLVVIPGLPAIAAGQEATGRAADAGAQDPAETPPAPAIETAALDPERTPPEEPTPPEAPQRDAPLAADTAIILTASDIDTAPGFAIDARLPEIVRRATTGHGGGWAVRLGSYATRFDAERALLRVTLAESGALGRGGRRVGQRGGRFLADVENLTQEQAELACIRLTARAQPCEVIAP